MKDEILEEAEEACRKAIAQRDALMNSLKELAIYIGISPRDWHKPHAYSSGMARRALEAIATVEGEKQ